MKMVCSDCDLGLKRSDCTEYEYVQCECRRWLIDHLKMNSMEYFVRYTLDEVLEVLCENEASKRQQLAKMIAAASKYLAYN